MNRSAMSAAWLILALGGGATVAGEGAPVRIAPAVVLEEAPRLWVPGTVLSRQDADVGVEVSGRLTSVAQPGSHVDAGHVVAALDDRRFRFQLAEADSRINRLEARLDFLGKEVARLDTLNARENVARNRLDEVRAEQAMAVEDRELALTERQRAAYFLELSRVRAPFPGQVVERLAEVGEYAPEGRAVVRLVNLRHREIRAQAPLRVAPFLEEGRPVPVRAGGGEVQVAISTIIPVGDLGSRSFEIRLEVDDTDWVIGAPVEVGLPTALAHRVVAVPRDALVLRNDDTLVFRINGEGHAERVLVETGPGVGDLVEVRGAIEPGDRVVVRGAETLRDGQAVELI